jgi:hypothetical protein
MLDLLNKLTITSLDFLGMYGTEKIAAGHIKQLMGPPI